MIALFMSYVHLSIDFWSMDKFFPPSASLLSTEVLLLSMKGDHPKDHTEELAFPQAGCFPHSYGSFCTFGSFSLGCPSFFCQPEKQYLTCLVSWPRHLSSGRPSTSNSMPLLCGFISPTTNHYAHLLSSPPPSLDCEPPTHVYPKHLYNSAWFCVQKIYSLNE